MGDSAEEFHDQGALVTGRSRGIGHAGAQTFLEHGAPAAICGKNHLISSGYAIS